MSKAGSPPPPRTFKASVGFQNFCSGKLLPLSKTKMATWDISEAPSTLAPLPETETMVTLVVPKQIHIPDIIIDPLSSSSSSSDSDTEEQEEKPKNRKEDDANDDDELDILEVAIDPLIQYYVDRSATSMVLRGRELSERALDFNELVKKYNLKNMKSCLREVGRCYRLFKATAEECMEGMESLMEINEENLFSKVAELKKRTTTTPTTPRGAKTTKKRKRKKSTILEKDQPIKYKPKGPYAEGEIKFLIDCQMENRFRLLAAEDDDGNHFDMTNVLKIMSKELGRPPGGISGRLLLGKLRLKDNIKANPILIKKMKKAKIFPWPSRIQTAQRARMLRTILKRRKKKRQKRKH